MDTRLQEDQARAAVAVGADMRRGNLVMHFVMAGCVQILAGVVAGVAMMLAVSVVSGHVEVVGLDNAAFSGMVMVGLLAFLVPLLFLLLSVVQGWSVLPLLGWLFFTARRPWVGLSLALASSAAVLAWNVRSALEGPRSLFPPGWDDHNAVAFSDVPLIENLAFSPEFITGWYLMPLVCWLWLPLRFEDVWWRLPLFAVAGAVVGGLLGPGAGSTLSDHGWALVASHAGYVIGLVWCRVHHRRSPDFADFGHPSRGGRPVHVALGEAVESAGAGAMGPETRAHG